MSLQALLDSRGISKYRLSQMSGVSKTVILDICSGKSSLENCTAKTVYQIALALDCTVEGLLLHNISCVSSEERLRQEALVVYNRVYSIKDISEQSKSIFDSADFVKKAFLFGSYARGEATSKSDLDFMIVLNREANLEFFVLYDLLQDVFGKCVDVLREEEAYRIMPESIERDKVLIYERKN